MPEHGRCEGDRRVVWCEDGVSKSFDCPVGSVCAWNEALYAFDCVTASCELDLDDDDKPEAIPATGLCADGRVVWCDKGHVRELECLAGVTCGWNAGIGAYDCVPSTGLAPDAGEPTDAADAGTSSDTSGQLPRGGGVLPVARDAGSSADVGAAGSGAASASAGCNAGSTGRGTTRWALPLTLVVGALMAVGRRRR